MQETKDRDDELSFQDFRRQMQQLRQFLREALQLAGRSIRRYYLLLIVLLAGFATWGYYEYKKSKVFEARSTFVYTELQKKVYGEMTDKLQQMIQYQSYNQLAQALQLPDSQARAILAIKAENIHGAKLSEDITENKFPFYISVVATNNRVFGPLQDALENYFNNNIFVKEIIARKTKVIEQKLAYGKQELAMLDSLKLAYTKSLDKAGSAYPSVAKEFNPVLLYDKGEKLNQELADMQAQLDDYRAVRTMDKFMVTERPNQKSVLTFGLRYFAFYLIASVFIIFILSIFRK